MKIIQGLSMICRFTEEVCRESGKNACEDCKILQEKVKKVEAAIRRWKPSAAAIKEVMRQNSPKL